MKRFKVLFGNRRMMVLLTLAVLVLAATALAASSASFTSESANPGNMFTAGNLKMTNSAPNTAVCTVTKLKPGDTNVPLGTVTISNVGDLPGHFTLTANGLVDTVGANGGPLSSVLNLRILQDGSSIFYGTLAALSTHAPFDLGTWDAAPPSVVHVYTFEATWLDGGAPLSDTTGDNRYKGSSASVNFNWKAVQ